MLILFRRFLVLVALMFWLGGFTFYASVVVPVGQRELGSHLEQGFITRQVTNYLNLSGAVALVVLAWDVAASRESSRASTLDSLGSVCRDGADTCRSRRTSSLPRSAGESRNTRTR